MSSRGAIIANNIVIDLDLLLQSTIVVDVRLRDVGICWKAPFRQWRFREIASSNENHVFLAMTFNFVFSRIHQ